jgi:hypothetical protein
MGSVLRYSLFESKPFGHGGEKRSSQISELLEECNLNSIFIPKGYDKSKFTTRFYRNFFLLAKLYLKLFFIIKSPFSIKKTLKQIIWAAGLKDIFAGESYNTKVFIYETSKLNLAPLIPYYKKKGFLLIGIPHNIESLVPGLESELSGKKSPYWLLEEIRFLKEFDLVFAISKEETLLLQQCGVNAKYLPYYPVEKVFEYLKTIRGLRFKMTSHNNGKRKLLMLGTVVNPPTLIGMKDRISFFEKHKLGNWDILVAGFGTNVLEKYLTGKERIQIVGELSDQVLSALLCEVDLVLIHQPPTSGSLTRIIELLISGIPVLVNFSSARDCYGINGIYVYYNDEQMLEYLSYDNYLIPDVPMKPEREYKIFQNIISNPIFNP